MGAIDTVVFDVGNVLVEWDPRHLYRKLFADAAQVEDFLTRVCPPEWNLEQDRGRPWAEAVAERAARHPEHAEAIAAFDRRWQEMVPRAIRSGVACHAALRAARVPIFAITNFSAEKWAECLLRFPFLRDFDGVVVSAHERLVKPDPAIYRVLFERHGVDPARAVFLDDSPANVAASEALGMRAIRITPESEPIEALRALGLPL